MKRHTLLPAAIIAGACVIVAGCGGSSSSGSSTTGPSTSGPALTIDLPSSQMTSGTMMQASAMLGSSAAPNVTWQSSNEPVASVSAAGVITGTRAGIATITAVSGGTTGTTTVRVNPGPPAKLTYYAGEGQSAPAGSPLSEPLCTQVVDAAGNAVIGVAVTYTVASGGGTVRDPVSPKTDNQGVAISGSLLLGPTKGEQRVIATAGSAPPLTFHATAQ